MSLAQPTSKTNAEVIAFAMQKGGVGKTTSATNFAASLAEMGFRVLLVDSDPQGNSSRACMKRDELKGKPTLKDVYSVDPRSAIMKTPHGFDLLPANKSLADLDAQIARQTDYSHYTYLRTTLGYVAEEYDYILIDLPPSLTNLTMNGMVAANKIFVPLNGEPFAVDGAVELMDSVERLQKAEKLLGTKVQISQVFMTNFDKRTLLHNHVYKQAQRYFARFGIPVCKTKIPRSVKYPETQTASVPAVAHETYKNLLPIRRYKLLVKEALGV